MTKREIKEFYEKNKAYTIGVIVLLALCIAVAWYVHDKHRNDTEYHNTDVTVAELEKRINGIEQRVGTMQDRLDKAEKTVERVAVGITRSTGYAIEINEGLGRTEERLESAVQRSERIKGIIADIEAANRQGTQNPQASGVAK